MGKKKDQPSAIVESKNVAVYRHDQDAVVIDVKWRSDFVDRHGFAADANCDVRAVEMGWAELNDKDVATIYQEKMDESQTAVTFVVAGLCSLEKKTDTDDVKPWSMPVKTEFDVRLTQDEINQRACEAADIAQKIEEKKETLKVQVSMVRDDVKKMEGHKRRLVVAVNTGRETKRVDCVQHFDPATRTTWYEYRGEAQGRRPMDLVELKEMQSRGGLYRDGIGGDPEKVSERLNGDELAKRVDAIEKQGQGEKAFNKKSKPPKGGLTIASVTGKVAEVTLKTANPVENSPA